MSDPTGVLTAERPGQVAPRFDAVMRSPLNQQHLVLGAHLQREAGWEIPIAYGEVAGERRSIREDLALADITARGKIDLRGSVDEVLGRLPQGGNRVIARIGAHWAVILTPPAALAESLSAVEAAAGPSAMATDATSIYVGFALLGPLVPEFLLRLTASDPSKLVRGTCLAVQLLRMPALLLRRDLPLIVVEAYLPSEYGRYAWESLLQTGAPLDIRPSGWDALRAEGWS